MSRENTADVLIIGGGIFGCCIAWHLKRLRPDVRVVVVERQRALATQATSQAAALLTRARANVALMPLIARTYAALTDLADELGQPMPAHRTGTLHVAASEQATRALNSLAAICVEHELRIEQPDPAHLRRLVPWLHPHSVHACLFTPEDGFIDPYLLADAYATAARRRGAQFSLGAGVASIQHKADRVQGVVLSNGSRLSAAAVVVAAGAWANGLTMPAGCALAMAPVRSQYWLTETGALFPRRHPVVILPDARAYTRPELDGLLFGLRERGSVAVHPGALPDDMSGYSFSDDPEGWRSLEEGAPAFARFFPSLYRVGIRRYVAGASTYTPDGMPLAGRLSGVDGLFAASGCCGAGIALSGGIGEALASLAVGDKPVIDISPLDPGRFGPIDPLQPAFLARCAAARAGKTAG